MVFRAFAGMDEFDQGEDDLSVSRAMRAEEDGHTYGSSSGLAAVRGPLLLT